MKNDATPFGSIKYKSKKIQISNKDIGEAQSTQRFTLGHLGIFLTIFSLLGIFLTLIGYGVAVSVNAVFDVPHEMIFNSPFELLELSVWFVMHFIEALPTLTFPELYKSNFKAFCLVAAIMFFVWVICIILLKIPKKGDALKGKKLPTWVVQLFQQPSNLESRKMLLAKATLCCIFFLFSAPVLYATLVILITAGAVMLPLVSIIGMEVGRSHIIKYAIQPKTCVPLANRTARLEELKNNKKIKTEIQATCLSLTKDGKELGRGYMVFTTSSAVILFNPDTG